MTWVVETGIRDYIVVYIYRKEYYVKLILDGTVNRYWGW
jgi:hypothetical protein